MNFITANWLLTCDNNFTVIKNGGIVFDEKIIEVGEAEILKEKFPNIKEKNLGKNSCLMPGLINPHIHLEFSANKTTLKYGNFNEWLDSVIANRDELINAADEELIDKTLDDILHSGTTTIGAISSYGFDLPSCAKSPMNVVFFNEVIGSKADMVDTLFADFKARVKNSKDHASNNFFPAVAIHSPYSVHPFLIREVLNIAKSESMPVTSHFMESPAEKKWLENSSGEFKPFFDNLLGQRSSLTTPMEFLEQFNNIENLSFTHCVEAGADELKKIKELDASIIHCPNSNRLLNNKTLNLNKIDKEYLSIATDGLSSNNSLSLFDELRNALFMHTEAPLNILAAQLLKAATKGGAKALGLNKGELSKGKDADIISFNFKDDIISSDDISTHILLHDKNIENIYIKGKLC